MMKKIENLIVLFLRIPHWYLTDGEFEMLSRLRNILRRNGFESLEGLREYPKEHFIKFRNMGQATLKELYQI